MPIIADDRSQYNLDRAINYVAPESDDTPFKQQLGAAFRLENTLISLTSREGNLPDGYADTNYDVFSKLTEEEKTNTDFVKIAALADNDEQLTAVRNQYQREMEDRKKLNGVDGVAAALLAGVLDPINLIPVGGAATASFRTGGILKGALMTGLTAAGSASLAEAGLHATQLTRTKEESAMNVTGAMLLGSIIGGGAAALNRSVDDLKFIQDDIEKTMEGPAVTNVTNDSAGAMAVWGDVRVKGKLVQKALKALSPIDPLAKVMTASSKAARKYGALLTENPLEIEGVTGRSIEQAARTKQQMFFGQALNSHIEAFTEAKKAGWKGKRNEFNNLVSREVANPGSTNNTYARRSAQAWSEKVYDPVAKELQELNMLGDDLDVKTAQQYLNRRWNKEAVAGKLNKFKQVVSAWLEETQPGIEDADELADQIAMRIMGTPDGMIRYDDAFTTSKRTAQIVDDVADIDPKRMEGIQIDEKVKVKETGEIRKVKADAAEVYGRLSKQKQVLQKLRGCLGA